MNQPAIREKLAGKWKKWIKIVRILQICCDDDRREHILRRCQTLEAKARTKGVFLLYMETVCYTSH